MASSTMKIRTRVRVGDGTVEASTSIEIRAEQYTGSTPPISLVEKAQAETRKTITEALAKVVTPS